MTPPKNMTPSKNVIQCDSNVTPLEQITLPKNVTPM